MKITLSRTALRNAVSLVLAAVATSKNTLPILANAKLDASADGISISATDLDVWLRVTLPVPASKSGAITIPARQLGSISNTMVSADLELIADSDSKVAIIGGASRFALQGMSVDEFPPDPRSADPIATITIKSSTLLSLLQAVSRCQSDDPTRHILNGVNFETAPTGLTLIATDGRRLGCSGADQIPVESESSVGGLVIPSKGAQALISTLGKSVEGDVSIKVFPGCAQFSFASDLGPVQLTLKLVDGNFPNWRQVVPAESTSSVTMDRDHLVAAIRRAKLFTSEKTASIKLTATEGVMTVHAETPEIGSANDPVTATITGPLPPPVAVDPDYLLDTLQSVEGKHITLGFIDALSPIAVTCSEVENWKHIIMPMRYS